MNENIKEDEENNEAVNPQNAENDESEQDSFLSTGHFSIHQQPDDTDIFHGE